MPGQRPILAMSFVASLGITSEVLACTLPRGHGNLWPLIILFYYLLLPLPIMYSKRVIKDTVVGMSDGCREKTRDFALFFTAGIIVSSVAMPILMARSPTESPIISPISCFLVEVGNILCYATIGLFCIYFKPINNS